MSDTEFFARLCHVQVQTDCTALPETRTVFSSAAAIQHLIEESSLTFATGLADMIQSRIPPSVQELRACSLPLSRDDLKSKWIVYLQYYRKGSLWYVYCGKSTNLRGGHERLVDYEYERDNIADSIRDVIKRGFKRTSHTILAAVDIPFEGADRVYVAALVTALEATFAAGLWAYSRTTLGSVTPLRFWEEAPWCGLCSHSSLMEITFRNLDDDLPNLDELRLEWKERQTMRWQKHRSSDMGKAASKRYNNSRNEAYRTDEEYRERKIQYRKQYRADGRHVAPQAQYQASAKCKALKAAYRTTDTYKKYKSAYEKSDRGKASHKKYAASEKGKTSLRKNRAKYRASEKGKAAAAKEKARRQAKAKEKRELKAKEQSASDV